MRAAVQGEGQLKSMPNNTAIMISFAACFASGLSAVAVENQSIWAPSVTNLIMETADVLERIGSTPSHRRSLPALYARHLREIVKHSSGRVKAQAQGASTTLANPGSTASVRNDLGTPSRAHVVAQAHNIDAMFSQQPLLFSAMSDSQIDDAINNIGPDLDMSLADFQVDDETGLIWRDWIDLG